MQVWSTEEGGGALAVFWDFSSKKVHASFFGCFSGGVCIYNTIDPGFMTPPDPPPSGYYPLIDGTTVRIEAVSLDPTMNISIEGNRLEEGVEVRLGTAPTLHVHPTWQLRTAEEMEDNYVMTFRLTTSAPSYAPSEVYSLVISNLPTPTPSESSPTPTPTGTPAPTGCPGDANEDDRVSVDELVVAVNTALRGDAAGPPLDANGDGLVSIDEVVAAVQASLDGCPGTAGPVTFERIQRTIFTPRCAIPTCHDSQFQSGNLVLTSAESYGQLVGIEPDILSARENGFLRVDPGAPENSFLLVKLEGPPAGEGSRMPLTGGFLTPEQVQLIHDWIALGAQP